MLSSYRPFQQWVLCRKTVRKFQLFAGTRTPRSGGLFLQLHGRLLILWLVDSVCLLSLQVGIPKACDKAIRVTMRLPRRIFYESQQMGICSELTPPNKIL